MTETTPRAGRRLSVTATTGDAGTRIDRVLAAHCPALSRSRLQALIREGQVRHAGATISEPSARVKAGQTFAIIVPETTSPIPLGQPIALTVIFEDEHLIVIDKPSGLVVHPAPGNPDATLVNALIAHCGASLSGIGGVRRPGIVHRLDKDTSGLMVAAKTDAAHAGLSAQFAARSIARAYTAVVWGVPRPAEGAYHGNIGRSPRNRKKMAVLATGGRTALTRYRVLARYGPARGAVAGRLASRLECRLSTGRTHQIRVHLAHAGHPLIGDPVYGGRRGRSARLDLGARTAAETIGRQALHAHLIGFTHPISGEELRFERDIPNDISNLISLLEIL